MLPPALTGAGARGVAQPRIATPWTVTAILGGERSSEQSYTDSVLLGRIGLEGSRWFAGDWLFVGTADWRSYRQQYVPFNGSPSARVTTDENRFDFGVLAGYDLGALLFPQGRLELIPLLGAQYLAARNTGYAFDMFGPSAGLRASLALARFSLRATAAWTYNLTKESQDPNAFLSPVSALSARAGLQFRLTPAHAIELDYITDGGRFEYVWRIAHGAVFAFSTVF